MFRKENKMTNNLKLVVVGDAAVEKTGLIQVYTEGELRDYIRTCEPIPKAKVKIGETTYTLNIWDTVGCQELEIIRSLSFKRANLFLLCFSVITPTTFDNITSFWIPEIKRYCPEKNVKIMLVGTKTDLRSDKKY